MDTKDLTLPAGTGYVNLRVGAIIIKDDAVLMVGNDTHGYYYSVGGRIQFGESAEDAVLREVEEETGHRLEIDRLGFIHENFFYGDSPSKLGKLIYEISFYYYMKVPENFEPVCSSFTELIEQEHLVWVPFDSPAKIFPAFFHTELKNPSQQIRHILTDERSKEQNACRSALLIIPMFSRRPGNSPPWPAFRCGRWACGSARDPPAAFPALHPPKPDIEPADSPRPPC